MKKSQSFIWKTHGRISLLMISIIVAKSLNRSTKELYKALLNKDSDTIQQIRRILKQNKRLRIAIAIGLVFIDALLNKILISGLEAIIVRLNRSDTFRNQIESLKQKLLNRFKNKTIKEYVDFMFQFARGIYRFQTYLIYGIAGYTEESSKFISNYFGLLKEYLIVFNIIEFTLYIKQAFKTDVILDVMLKHKKAKLMSVLKMNESEFKELEDQLKNFSTEQFVTIIQEVYGIEPNTEKHNILISYAAYRKYKRTMKFQMVYKMFARLFTAILHVMLGFLHKKNRTMEAIVAHASYNIAMASVIDFVLYKHVTLDNKH